MKGKNHDCHTLPNGENPQVSGFFPVRRKEILQRRKTKPTFCDNKLAGFPDRRGSCFASVRNTQRHGVHHLIKFFRVGNRNALVTLRPLADESLAAASL
jgi:hypothetical protein